MLADRTPASAITTSPRTNPFIDSSDVSRSLAFARHQSFIKTARLVTPVRYDAIKSLLRRDLGKVAIFIDGLDEYHGVHPDHLSPNQARPEHYREIVTLIKSLRPANVKGLLF
jgi:hypothetical protein